VRDPKGGVKRIVEQKDATTEELEIQEVNSGIYVFDSVALFEILPNLGTENSQGEYYLTDAVETLAAQGGKVEALAFQDSGLLMGVNDRWQLAMAEKIMRQRILQRHAVNGVSLQDIDSIYIDADVEIGTSTTLEAGTHLRGATKVGQGCRIGPNTVVVDSNVDDGSIVLLSHVRQAKIGTKVKVGPFANIRPGAVLGDGSKVGNFVELKNATLGPGVAASHLAYIGDAEVGAGSNIGAGTITCNYDGDSKYRTSIGENVFVGSNSTLVAPLTIGDGAFVAAGSVITHDVPSDALALGRARQEVKEGWVPRWRKRKK
jgi:bifunctional UDP-N-acetylglucosamine pyrophosphorylase/glucosamine-1-phosphate N-acetyltransferase